MEELGLKVETLNKSLYVSSPLKTRVSVKWICRNFELEIFRILLIMDLKVMDMTEFDVILMMDWLMAHRVIIDCDRRRVTSYTRDGVCVVLQGNKHNVLTQIVYDSMWHGQLRGWLASLTLEDEVRKNVSLPRVVYQYEDVFPDELSRLPSTVPAPPPPPPPPLRDVDFCVELNLSTSPISMTPHRMALVGLLIRATVG